MATADDRRLLGPVGATKAPRDICRSWGITDSQLQSGALNWQTVYPLFLDNARDAYVNRKEVADGTDGRRYVGNAIIGTIKLLLCALPNTVPDGTASRYDSKTFYDQNDGYVGQIGDWAYGSFKGECAAGQSALGIAATAIGIRPDLRPTGCSAHRTATASTLAPCRAASPRETTARTAAPGTGTGVTTKPNRGGARAQRGGAECAPDEAVVGVASTGLDGLRNMDKILCARIDPGSAVRSNTASCTTLTFSSYQDQRLDYASGDWDVGYSKNECAPNQILKGVSSNPYTGEIHAILCCDQQGYLR